jgi:hypothetical protein
VQYVGVSIVEFERDRIQRFRAYFNPVALVPHPAPERKGDNYSSWPFC